MDDLRAIISFVADNRKEISEHYGLVSTSSIAAIQRALLTLDRDGGQALFGEPALDLTDLLRTDLSGRGVVNILSIAQLGVGEALVSTLQEGGVPMPVERALICPPRCRMGAITPEERGEVRGRSPVGGKYDTRVNRESAFEILSRRVTAAEKPDEKTAPRAKSARTADASASPGGALSQLLWGTKRRQGLVETMAKQAARTASSQISRQILRGVLGGILGGSRRR
jgi:Helicase HerA-like C-terminal